MTTSVVPEHTLLLVLDLKGDYADLPERLGRDRWDHYSVHDGFRLGLQPPGDLVPPGVWITQVAKTIASNCNLVMAVSPLAAIIRLAMETMNQSRSGPCLWPSLHQLRDIVKRFINSVGAKVDYARSLRTSLDYLLDNSGELFHACRGWDAWNHFVVPRRCAVIDLTLLEPQACSVVVELIAAQLLLVRLYRRLMNAPPVMFVIDEADYLCSERGGQAYPEGYSCLGQMLKQGRAFGLSVCLGVSVLGEVSRIIRNNITYHFTFAQPDHESIVDGARTLGIPRGGESLLASLTPGLCVYREAQGPCSFPMLARTDLIPASDMPRPDRFDQASFAPDPALSELPEVLEVLHKLASQQKQERRSDVRKEHDGLPDMARKLLDLASLHPYTRVGVLWDKLGDVSPGVKSSVRKRLERDELATFVTTRCGKTSHLLISLTDKGWELLGKERPAGEVRGGIEHGYHCRVVKAREEGRGRTVFLEWHVPGTQHWADLAFKENGAWTCIEIVVDCTSNLVGHLQACFLQTTAVSTVIIVVSQKSILRDVHAQVASEASLFPYMSRVRFDVIDSYLAKE